MLNIDSITSNSNYSIVDQEQLFTELTAEEGAIIEGGKYTILIRDVGPATAPVPTQAKVQYTSLDTANPTVLQITNGTGYNLSYSLGFDAPNAGSNLSIAPGVVSDFLGRDPKAIAKWDLSLLIPGIQEVNQELAPGRRYEFYEA